MLRDPPTDTSDTELFFGHENGCTRYPDGRVICFEPSDEGSLRAPEYVLFSSVEVGEDFTCGVTLDGEIQCWGAGEQGHADVHPIQ